MAKTRSSFIAGLVVAFVLSMLGRSLPARAADDDAALRQRAVALNDITGDNPIKGEIKTLVESPAETKKLLAVAAKMAKEKNQPFNYNGAYILARTALILNDLSTSRILFNVCAEQASKLQSAQKLGSAYIGIDRVIALLYAEKKYEESAKASKEFLETLEKQGVKEEFKAEVYRGMVKSIAKLGKMDEATKLTDTLLKSKENNWHNMELKAWLENEKGRFAEAAKYYQDALDHVGKDKELEKKDLRATELDLRRSLVRTLLKQDKKDEATKVAQAAGSDWRALELRAFLQQESDKPDEAAKTYEKMLGLIAKDEAVPDEEKKVISSEIHYYLSGIYIDLNQVNKAADELKGLLAQEPDSARYNNDLGYIWADHDMNLDEAEKMIRKAIEEDRKLRKSSAVLVQEEDKDNAAYLDSLGWVLFKKKNYPEAKKYLLDAVKEKDGQHIEIMDHLGDVHMALGEKADALAVWKKALETKVESNREKQRKAIVEKKIKANQ